MGSFRLLHVKQIICYMFLYNLGAVVTVIVGNIKTKKSNDNIKFYLFKIQKKRHLVLNSVIRWLVLFIVYFIMADDT